MVLFHRTNLPPKISQMFCFTSHAQIFKKIIPNTIRCKIIESTIQIQTSYSFPPSQFQIQIQPEREI
jgi:hypothetical protein